MLKVLTREEFEKECEKNNIPLTIDGQNNYRKMAYQIYLHDLSEEIINILECAKK